MKKKPNIMKTMVLAVFFAAFIFTGINSLCVRTSPELPAAASKSDSASTTLVSETSRNLNDVGLARWARKNASDGFAITDYNIDMNVNENNVMMPGSKGDLFSTLKI